MKVPLELQPVVQFMHHTLCTVHTHLYPHPPSTTGGVLGRFENWGKGHTAGFYFVPLYQPTLCFFPVILPQFSRQNSAFFPVHSRLFSCQYSALLPVDFQLFPSPILCLLSCRFPANTLPAFLMISRLFSCQ